MAQIKENIKAPRHWPLWGKSTGDRWIPRTKDHNAENGSIWWRNHVHVIPILLQELQLKVFHPIQKTCNKTICYIWHNGQPYCSCIPIMGLWSSSWNATERWPLRTEGITNNTNLWPCTNHMCISEKIHHWFSLPLVRCEEITWTSAKLLSTGLLGIIFGETVIRL